MRFSCHQRVAATGVRHSRDVIITSLATGRLFKFSVAAGILAQSDRQFTFVRSGHVGTYEYRHPLRGLLGSAAAVVRFEDQGLSHLHCRCCLHMVVWLISPVRRSVCSLIGVLLNLSVHSIESYAIPGLPYL